MKNQKGFVDGQEVFLVCTSDDLQLAGIRRDKIERAHDTYVETSKNGIYSNSGVWASPTDAAAYLRNELERQLGGLVFRASLITKAIEESGKFWWAAYKNEPLDELLKK